jgi:site-specific recombinase XerD
MGYGPAMTADYRPSLVRSFERHLRAENRSEHTIASYLESLRQAEAFLAGRGRSLLDARRGELADLQLSDLDLDLEVALVLGKGRRERALPYGRKTAVALDRYLRVRPGTRMPISPGCGLGSAAG